MKKIIFWFLLCVPFCSFSQIKDDFSDGAFSNPYRTTNWTGDVDKFIVNNNLQLQLNAPKESGSAQLRTTSALSSNASWEFWVKLGFNPTSSNYTKVYLCSETENLTESPNSLYIRIGYTNKNICLISKEGTSEKILINGTKDRLNLASPTLNVKATLNKAGVLELYSKLEGDPEYVLEGSCTITTTLHSSYFGVICQYTSTRNTHFFFDNFIIRKLTEEENPTIVDDVKIGYPDIFSGTNAYEIQYRFSNPGNHCRAFIYDTMGRMVNIIANNELLGMEGKLYWYGNNASGQKLYSGVYIVYVEIRTPNGKIKKFKLPVVMK